MVERDRRRLGGAFPLMTELRWRHVPLLVAVGQIVVVSALGRWVPGPTFEPMALALVSVLLILLAVVGWVLIGVQEAPA